MARETLRVLIVEDSEDDAFLVERQLRKAGFDPECLRVQSADEMRNALQDGKWDVVISDYLMPGFNAMGAMQIYRSAGLDIPFIVVSGSIGEDVAVEAMKQGVHDYLMKDNLTRFAVTIDRELREAKMRRERSILAHQLTGDVSAVLSEIRSVAADSTQQGMDPALQIAALKRILDAAERGYAAIEKLRQERRDPATASTYTR